MVQIASTNDEAADKCLSYGMAFYNPITAASEKALLDYGSAYFKSSLGATLRVAGKTAAGCSVVKWVNGVFGVVSTYDCTSRGSFYCQFSRKPGK
jgi:hypothetical protein